MTIDWNGPKSKDRLLAAIVAAQDEMNVIPKNNVFLRRVAELFGQGATYWAIDGQFRKVRKLAEQLKTEAGGEGHCVETAGEIADPAVQKSPSTPRKARGRPRKDTTSTPTKSVLAGRINKNTPTPTKKVRRQKEQAPPEANSVVKGTFDTQPFFKPEPTENLHFDFNFNVPNTNNGYDIGMNPFVGNQANYPPTQQQGGPTLE